MLLDIQNNNQENFKKIMNFYLICIQLNYNLYGEFHPNYTLIYSYYIEYFYL
jgi:hypothetical protein